MVILLNHSILTEAKLDKWLKVKVDKNGVVLVAQWKLESSHGFCFLIDNQDKLISEKMGKFD